MVYLNHMENVVIKKRKKLNVKNLCLLIFFLVMLIVFLFSLIKVIMWIIDNNNTNDIIKQHTDIIDVINAVLDKFGNMTAKSLSNWSHQIGSPWDITRNTTTCSHYRQKVCV